MKYILLYYTEEIVYAYLTYKETRMDLRLHMNQYALNRASNTVPVLQKLYPSDWRYTYT